MPALGLHVALMVDELSQAKFREARDEIDRRIKEWLAQVEAPKKESGRDD